jgi:hypothetical protein
MYAQYAGFLTPTTFALNLFFNGDDFNPGISAEGGTRIGLPIPAFTPNGASSTWSLNDFYAAPGANSLVFVDGGTTVTLTEYWWARYDVFLQDVVQEFNNTPGSTYDYVGRFTLEVTPEPSTLLLLGPALAGLMMLGWRGRA